MLHRFELEIEKRDYDAHTETLTHTHISTYTSIRLEKRRSECIHMPNGDRIVENDQSVDTRSVLKRIHNHTHKHTQTREIRTKIRYSCPKTGKSQRCTGRTRLCEKERTISQNTIEQFAADRFECTYTKLFCSSSMSKRQERHDRANVQRCETGR